MVDQSYSDTLIPINTKDFLPSVSRWVTLGSWFIVLVLGGVIAASFFVKYRTTVKAPAVIRPAGEPRLIQAITTGPVVSMQAKDNTYVHQGDIIAQLDTSSIEARAIQLLANLEQVKSRLLQIDAQLISADQQLAAETAQSQRAVIAFAADYDQTLRSNRDQSISAQSAVQEAQAQLNLATQEVNSFSRLVESGAVSRLQLYEKQSALAAAEARMTSLRAALNPSQGEVQAAQARIAQAEAGGAATIARLQQSKQQLNQQKLEVIEQLQDTEQEIAQVNLELQNSAVRSPISGTLYELNLRNAGQVVNVGETLAKVIPAEATTVIKVLVPTQQINKVEMGLVAQLRVSACPFSEFGTVQGQVTEISPDLATPEPGRNGYPPASVASSAQSASAYSVTIETETSELLSSRNEKCSLLPGMEGQATIISRKETVINFLRRKAGLLTNF